MAINFRSNTIISNLRIGPLSGGGGGGGGGSSEPSYLVVGANGANNSAGVAYIYDATNYSAVPTKLAPSGLAASDSFGYSVAATSNQIVVGASYDDDQGNAAGAAYVYDATNLSATPTKLAPTGLGAGDNFGWSVAATSNQIVVGARYDDDQGNNAGAVYVYDATNLSATPTKLTPSGLGTNDQFGHSIAATSNQIVVGVWGDDDQGGNAGAVYVYDATNLSTTPTKLTPSGLDASDSFGYSVAATSNQIVVGASYDEVTGGNTGAVYVYDAANLSATPTKLAPSGLDADDYFGSSVAATSNQIVVGALFDDDQGSNAGAVYVYDATNLSATPTKLAPSGLGQYDNFGHSVAATSNQIIVGAFSDNDQGNDAGAVYVYDATNLSAAPTKLTATDGGSNHQFGYSVSLG
jgi:hypothetical protein